MISLKDLHIESLTSISPQKNIKVGGDESSSKVQRLSKAIGIKSKYVCDPSIKQKFSTLCEAGILHTLESLSLNHNDVDAIIVVTQSPDFIIPGTAVLLQDRCGFTQDLVAYDINLGCSGFPYGLLVAHGHLMSGMKRVLLVVGDQSYSPGTKDEGHGVLFGDGAAVASLVLKDDRKPTTGLFSTDGSGYKALYIPHGGKVRPVNIDSHKLFIDEMGVSRSGTDVVLDGPNILSFSLLRAPEQINKLLSLNDVDKSDVDYYFLHQANKIINDTIRKKMKLSADKFPLILEDFGNTSSASIPNCMTARGSGLWNKNNIKNIISGFGIGLSWATLLYISDGTEKSEHIFTERHGAI